VAPRYPSLARDLRIEGIVKAEVVVTPNGTAKAVEIKGGHPVLTRAAQEAILRWKWEPGQKETRESVEVKFNIQ
jgi:TonB family protein